jgi:hypothetical protein
MWHRTEQDATEEFYLAGERVAPGIYRQVGGHREVQIDQEDVLPASLDGRVACYLRVHDTWRQIASDRGVGVCR